MGQVFQRSNAHWVLHDRRPRALELLGVRRCFVSDVVAVSHVLEYERRNSANCRARDGGAVSSILEQYAFDSRDDLFLEADFGRQVSDPLRLAYSRRSGLVADASRFQNRRHAHVRNPRCGREFVYPSVAAMLYPEPCPR